MTPFALPADAHAEAATTRLAAFVPLAGRDYARGRNVDAGPEGHTAVSGLSPWLRHRLIVETDVLGQTLDRHSPSAAEKFVQEVFWRGYFKGWLEHRPEVWSRYRSAVTSQIRALDTDASLAQRYTEAVTGRTGIDCFDFWAQELRETHYLHNHARMWFASIWIFTLKLPWELGADFFYRHLLDGDAASNTCSWRWVGGLHTMGKTYLARPDNIETYTRGRFNPVGQLATQALPLTEPELGPRVPPQFGMPDLVGLRTGLLLTQEDCAPQSLEGVPEELASVFAWTDPGARSLLPTAKPVQAFARAAVQSAATQAEACYQKPCVQPDEGEDAAEALVAWARQHQLDAVITARMPQGPTRRAALTALREADLACVELTRPYDQAVWPHAKAGFFGLKKKIPAILTTLGLERQVHLPL